MTAAAFHGRAASPGLWCRSDGLLYIHVRIHAAVWTGGFLADRRTGQGRGAAVGLVLDRGLFMGVPQVRRRMCALCLVCGTVQGSPLAAGGALLWRRTTNGTTGPHYTVCLLLL
jgi:hypothetical protein